MKNITYTTHSLKRARQRGIKKEIIEMIYKEADKIVKKMGNARAIYISKIKVSKLHQLNTYKKDVLEKSKNIYLIISESESLLTVVRTKRPVYRRNIKYSLIA